MKKTLALILLLSIITVQCGRPFKQAASSSSMTLEQKKAAYPKKAGKWIEEMRCRRSAKLNIDSIANETFREQVDRYLWADACPKARGVFTLDGEYSGETYSCANFPKSWGINSPPEFFKDPSKYAEHLEYLSLYLEGVYNTTAVKGPNACDFFSFSQFFCGADREEPWRRAPWAEKIGNKPIRGVNMGGLFLLEPWITPAFTNWVAGEDDEYTYSELNPAGSMGAENLETHWRTWYEPSDYTEMREAGLNAIRLPLGWWFFAEEAKVDLGPYLVPSEKLYNISHPISTQIRYAQKEGLAIFIDLHGAPASQNGLDNSGRRSTDDNPERWGYEWFYDKDAQTDTTRIVVEIAKWIKWLEGEGVDNIVALSLLNEPWVFSDMSVIRDWYREAITQVRAVVPDMPIIVSDAFRHTEWVWLMNDWPYENTFMDTHIYHAFNPDDIASSTPTCDKLKQTIAENIACGYGALMRYKTCTTLPVFMGEWSLAIDDCIGNIRGQDYSVQFKDFGQCKHLKERVGDPWWRDHVNSFAARQMEMAERELGWFFWTWKTDVGAKDDPSNAYWSFRDAIKAGFITTPISDDWIQGACDLIVDDGGSC